MSGFTQLVKESGRVPDYLNQTPAFEGPARKGINEEGLGNLPLSSSSYIPLRPLTRQDRLKFVTKESALEALAQDQPLIHSTHQFYKWVDVRNESICHVAARMADIETQVFLCITEEARLREYLTQCWHVLEENFQNICERIKQGKLS